MNSMYFITWYTIYIHDIRCLEPLDFPCVTLTKGSKGSWEPRTMLMLGVKISKKKVKQKMANFKLEKMTP